MLGQVDGAHFHKWEQTHSSGSSKRRQKPRPMDSTQFGRRCELSRGCAHKESPR